MTATEVKKVKEKLAILFVDDDPDNIRQFKAVLPNEIAGHKVFWDFSGSFESGLERLSVHHYDLLVTDVQRGRPSKDRAITEENNGAKDLVDTILKERFCPIILFSDGGIPESFEERPFLKFISKGSPDFEKHLTQEIENLIVTGVPIAARRMHNLIDKYSGSYLWEFLEGNWQKFSDAKISSDQIERIVMRRAALLLGRLEDGAEGHEERSQVHSVDYYIYPRLSGDYRLGEIIRHKEKNEFFVVLTPHCHLMRQPGQQVPRAEYIVLVHAIPATAVLKGKSSDKIARSLSRLIRIQGHEDTGKPEGRYSFLPGFLDIPDLYCDMLRITHIPFADLDKEYERVAVLDAPFAEAVQMQMAQFYSSIGLPTLIDAHFAHLAGDPPAQSAAG